MDYTFLTGTGLIYLNPSIPVIGCTAVGIRNKIIAILKINIETIGILDSNGSIGNNGDIKFNTSIVSFASFIFIDPMVALDSIVPLLESRN